MNPIIYSKIHLKVYASIRTLIVSCKGNSPCRITPKYSQNESLKPQTESFAEPLTKSTSQSGDPKPHEQTTMDIHLTPEQYDINLIKKHLLQAEETPV